MTDRHVQVFSGTARQLADGLRFKPLMVFSPNEAPIKCPCGRPGCDDYVPTVKHGKRKYATNECYRWVKRQQENERRRNKPKSDAPKSEPKHELYCSKCCTYRSHKIKHGSAKCKTCGREKAAP